MKNPIDKSLITLDVDFPIWDYFFTVAPLVVVGSKEGEVYDLAPKHLAMPMGWSNYFGFMCTPRHGTYHNVKHHRAFTVSYPKADQIVNTSLTASTRIDKSGFKPVLENMETVTAEIIDGIFLKESYLFLECELDRIIDGFGDNSLITGKVIASHVHKDAYRPSLEDDQKLLFDLPLITYLNPGRFSIVKETNAFPFPANFNK